MEIIKRNKTAQRAAFTKVYTKLESVMINENANAGEIELCLHLLKQKTDSLELTHNEYLDALTDETEFITEFNIVEEYREKALNMEFKSKRVLEKIKSKQNNNESSNFGDNSHLAVCENPYKNTSPRLPELELYKFGGELRDWLTFWNQFKNIHENKNLTNCDKFHYLVQSTKIKSEARELIESFPITDENYPLAIESLTERYGRKERYYGEFSNKLQDSFYVDNCVTSVQNNAELEIFVESATNVMKEGMLDRRGCESSALSASSERTRSPVLGLIWDKNLNALEIDTEYLEFDEREKITKREILSLVSPVFDPIGFLAPVMIQPKILLQATWKAKESWDEEVNNEIK
ncbi:reverse transcriptase [Caerostris extrusa]|uniref:Reverse transcriptase n=1 Tax=Caerostris extrusa TaxID=172846 RepID=A0AAV4T0D1_CAEEX|nr:reverse transcriptase [Caerostris extrusa]